MKAAGAATSPFLIKMEPRSPGPGSMNQTPTASCLTLTSSHGQLWSHDVVLATTVTAEGSDYTAREGVSLEAKHNELLVDGHGLFGLALGVTIASLNHPGTVSLLSGDAGSITRARKFVGARACIGTGGDAHTSLVAGVVVTSRLGQEIIRHGSTISLNLCEERTLAEVVAAVLLDDEVTIGTVGRAIPLKAIDILERDLGGVRDDAIRHPVGVGHGLLCFAVCLDTLAAELDLRGNVLLTLKQSV
mmetsp:Transcript_134253/g.199769  ORF Transcript_134253/g.199769 Transcript_134253/m.199769 type:complete len:246 (+) Transcript_134253:203-940(+)